MLRVVALDLGDLLKVLEDWPVADQLNVIEAHHARLTEIDRAVARKDVDDRLADRLPDCAAPALIERLGDLPVGVRRWTGRQPEWIRTFDTSEIRSKISHTASYRPLPPLTAKHRIDLLRRGDTLSRGIHDLRTAVCTIAADENIRMVLGPRELSAGALSNRHDHHVARYCFAAVGGPHLD